MSASAKPHHFDKSADCCVLLVQKTGLFWCVKPTGGGMNFARKFAAGLNLF